MGLKGFRVWGLIWGMRVEGLYLYNSLTSRMWFFSTTPENPDKQATAPDLCHICEVWNVPQTY